ncbi:MAG: hypothetical protein M1832_006025 [Thelocarpon impressellum]|nr:MAG: hypothetical protein M1832_006025 [Thelocarpon impressellum]
MAGGNIPPSPAQPSLPWRTGSSVVMAVTGFLSRTFLFGASRPEVHGLDGFLRVLDARRDVDARERGLLTVSNHISVLDDPMMWGVLPLKYFSPSNLRWGLGSYDICFKNKPVSIYFTLGQVLPTHRSAYSRHGGLFQPTMTQCIRLLSCRRDALFAPPRLTSASPSISCPDVADPFSAPYLTYTTDGVDIFPAPSAYPSRRHSWVHIFPEGKVHQHARKTMRYFKWGVARLILEAEPLPQIIPIWIEGADEVMPEARTAPRFVPRPGKHIQIVFGDEVDAEAVFGDLRRRWRKLHADEVGANDLQMGELTERLKHGEEAVSLREECTRRVRQQVLKVRRGMGLPDEDPKAGLVETYRQEGAGRQGEMADGSWVKEE